jgi:hypothetical protein
MCSTCFQASEGFPLDSNELECEPLRSAKLTHSADESSSSTGQTFPATTTSQLLLPLDLPQMESSRLWPTPRHDGHSGGGGMIASMEVVARGLEKNGYKSRLEEAVCLGLTSSAAAFPAKTSALPEKAKALRVSDRAYGRNTPELLAKYDHATSSWRTSQLCLDGDLTEFSETWPRSGLMLNGIAYQLPPLVRLTDETACGLWPTPHSNASTGPGRQGRNGGMNIQTAVAIWPTPTGRDWKDGSAQSCKNVPVNGLLGRMVHYPTLGGTRPNDADQVSGRLANEIGGALNPVWVEWLMGFPLAWTDCGPSAMRSFRRSRKSSDEQS